MVHEDRAGSERTKTENFIVSDLSGRSAVVTGGAGGIGRATAVGLARQGAAVVVGDLRWPDEDAEMNRLGVTRLTCDVRCEDDVARLIRSAAERQPLGIVVNNAGIGLTKQIPEVTETEWDDVLDTNLKAAFLTAKHAIPHMRRRGGGVIVNVSSNAGLLPRAHDPVYSISKAALLALTRSLALCHATQRIRVNAVCPGPVGDTGMMNADLAAAADPEALAREFIQASPLARAWGRMIAPAEIAAAVLYLVSDAAMMVTGTAIGIDGGKSLGVPPVSDGSSA